MWKKADALLITQEQQKIMDAWIRGKKTPQRIALRSRICLLAAEGISHNAIAKKLNTSRSTVILWIKRFQERGLTGISEDATHA
jgi:DNA-binding NarL/FixJ family response regulator